MQLKALLFDVDGTLADTEPQGHLPSYNDAFREMGLDWHWTPELYRRELLLLPGGRERIRHFLIKHKPPLGDYAKDSQADLAAWVNRVHAAKSRWFRRRLESGQVQLRPGVKRLIEQAHAQDLRMAVVTNASRRSLKPFLNHTLGKDLLANFEYIVSGEQVEHKKPAPDLYQRAVAQLGLQPEQCLAIEDSFMGLCSAASAGLRVLITVNEDTREHDFSAATAVVSGLGEPEAPWEVLCSTIALNGAGYATPEVLDRLLAR